MRVFRNPPKSDWEALVSRPAMDPAALDAAVLEIMQSVKSNGDEALFAMAKKFDQVVLSDLRVSTAEFEEAEKLLSSELKQAIQQAAANIEKFHLTQTRREERVETMPGVVCWRKSVGIERVGFYIPGGTAPLFSTVLMLGIPAAIAACGDIVLCTPPNKDGKISPAILFAAKLVGVTKVFKAGGAQAIAAMTYGTASIPSVYKIFGPGNQYVTSAKRLAQLQGVAIDMPAGPSEVCVLADQTAEPAFVAADLISQAEHGADSQVLLVSLDENIAKTVQDEIGRQLEKLPRMELARKSLDNSRVVIMDSLADAIALVNAYAPEHLIISCEAAEEIAGSISNAGSIFLGNYSPESVGDYASGTNHTLPTHGFARVYSGVSVDSFVKKITIQQLTKAGLQAIAPTVDEMAMAEGLQAHAEAVRIRLNKQ